MLRSSAVGGTEGERLSSRGRQRLIRVGRAPLVALLAAARASRRRRWAHSRARTPARACGSTRRTTPTSTAASPTTSRAPTCTNVFGQQYERFGFAPNGSQATALYHNPTRPARAALLGAEHARGPHPARPGAGRLGRPRMEVLDGRGERAGRDPRHRHPVEQQRPAQEGGAEPRRAAAAAEQLRPVRAVRLQLRRRLQRRRLRERPARVGHRPATTTSPARTRSSTPAT